MGLLSRGESWLADKTVAVGGVAVTYKRKNVSAVLTATPGDQQVAALRLGQVQTATSNWLERDYLISVADLETAGFTGPPQKGDRITETINGEAVTFELMPKSGGTQPWAWSGTGRTMYRVYTKRV